MEILIKWEQQKPKNITWDVVAVYQTACTYKCQWISHLSFVKLVGAIWVPMYYNKPNISCGAGDVHKNQIEGYFLAKPCLTINHHGECVHAIFIYTSGHWIVSHYLFLLCFVQWLKVQLVSYPGHEISLKKNSCCQLVSQTRLLYTWNVSKLGNQPSASPCLRAHPSSLDNESSRC